MYSYEVELQLHQGLVETSYHWQKRVFFFVCFCFYPVLILSWNWNQLDVIWKSWLL